MSNTNRGRRAWQEEEDAQIRAAYAAASSNEGLDLRGLSIRLGRTYASVAVRASRLGLGNYFRQGVDTPKVRVRKFATVEERNAAAGERTRQHIAERGHPRGALGLRHTPEALLVIAGRSRAAWAAPGSALRSDRLAQRRSDNAMEMMMTRPPEKQHTRSAGGRRADLGDRYFRSSWEANYARWLNVLVQQGTIAGWEYEPKVFVFTTITRGTRTYKPDFRVDLNGGGHEWHEVKGWMDPKSKTRLDRMARHYPDERVVIIDATWFRDANRKIGPMIHGWEGRK